MPKIQEGQLWVGSPRWYNVCIIKVGSPCYLSDLPEMPGAPSGKWVSYYKNNRKEVARYEKLAQHINKYRLRVCPIREGDLVELPTGKIEKVERVVTQNPGNPFLISHSINWDPHLLKQVFTI